jgi:hypothetical protein
MDNTTDNAARVTTHLERNALLADERITAMATKSSASEVKVQHRSLLIERDYEEFTGRLEQILGRFVESTLKGLTPDGAMEALKSMEGEQGLMIIQIFDHGADDQPSTLFGRFGRSEVTAVGAEDDGKLERVIAKAAMT